MDKTEKVLYKFNKRANDWLADLQALKEEKIQRRPTEKSWSIAELYDHVMRVARTYQIPHFHKSLSDNAERKKRKNKYGIALFNLGIRKKVKIKMEEFPAPLVADFTPQKRKKADLENDFITFIKEVNDLEEILKNSTKQHKQYHPMFGDLTAREWFSLIELHIWHHEKQKDGIKEVLSC